MKYFSLVLLAACCFAFSGCDKDCNAKSDGNCACILIYDPVCGCNNVTYGNSCEAECNNITDYTPGEC